MGGRKIQLDDIELLCFVCPVPVAYCDSDSLIMCPLRRWYELRSCEASARRAGYKWLSRRQVKRLLAQVEEKQPA